MAVSIIAWILIGAFLAWITGVLWSHKQGCIMDGVVAIAGVFAGTIVYGAIVGSEQLIELTFFSILAGVVTGFAALAIVRAVERDVEAETEPSAEEAAGWESEEAPPELDEPPSEREPEDLGEGGLSEQGSGHPPEEPVVDHEPRNVDTENRPEDGSPGPEEVPEQEEPETPHDEDTPPPRA